MTAPSFPIYSPSETEKYLQCPRLRVLEKDWEPRVKVWEPWRDLGIAVHAGLAAHYAPQGFSPVEVALSHWAEMTIPSEEWTYEAIAAITTRGLQKGLTTDLIGDGRVLGVELRPAGYHAVLDLLHETPGQDLVITDHKVKKKYPKFLNYATDEYDPAWQSWHYAWVVWREYHRVPSIQYHLIFLQPSVRAHLFIPTTQPTEEGLQLWERNARQVWLAMAKDREGLQSLQQPPSNPRSCHAYGRLCDFYKFCWSGLNGRPQDIDMEYVRKERHEEEVSVD